MAVNVKAVVKQVSGSTSEGSVRSHTVRCDRPEAKGGSDGGAMGGELFLIGLGGCFMSNLLAAIQSRESQISEPSVAINGQLDGTPPRFTEIDLEVSASVQDKEELKKLVIIAERGCIVANTIKDSVSLNIRVS
jgi:putative redox protein